jgi:hypothetical protein
MGLLMSDMPRIDPMVDETMRLLDSLTEWAYPEDIGGEADERDDATTA